MDHGAHAGDAQLSRLYANPPAPRSTMSSATAFRTTSRFGKAISSISMSPSMLDGWHGDSSRMYPGRRRADQARRRTSPRQSRYECADARASPQASPGATHLGDDRPRDPAPTPRSDRCSRRPRFLRPPASAQPLPRSAADVLHVRPGRRTGPELRPGMIFTVEPMINHRPSARRRTAWPTAGPRSPATARSRRSTSTPIGVTGTAAARSSRFAASTGQACRSTGELNPTRAVWRPKDRARATSTFRYAERGITKFIPSPRLCRASSLKPAISDSSIFSLAYSTGSPLGPECARSGLSDCRRWTRLLSSRLPLRSFACTSSMSDTERIEIVLDALGPGIIAAAFQNTVDDCLASAEDEMTTPQVERRTTAVLVADVVGYCQLVETNEERALAAIKELWGAVFRPLIAEYRGRIVKLMGDGLIAEFGSVVGAVACAAAVQEKLAVQQQQVAAERRIVLRISINLGDVVIDGDDLLGDGVNVAARLEQLCPPGTVLDLRADVDCSGKLDLHFEYVGAAPKEYRTAGEDLLHGRRRADALRSPPADDPTSRRSLFCLLTT